MDTKSYHIVKTLLQLTEKNIWDFAVKQTETLGKSHNWSQDQIQKATGQNYNDLVRIKYQATDAIREKLTPEQRVLQTLTEKEVREVASSEAQKQLAGQSYTDIELKKTENNLYQQLMDERTKAVNLLSGKVAHPDINLATFDTTDIKNEQKINEMREQITPLDLGKGGENILTKTVGLTTQNIKETIKDPLGAIWNSDERRERNIQVISGKTLEEANFDMQERKDRKPLNILTNFLSGNPDKQDRALKGIKSMFNNLLSGTGNGSKILPALAGFTGTKMAGFGSVTSIVVAVIAALVVPMIMRAFNGNKAEIETAQTSPENKEEKQTENTLQKMDRTRQQTLQKSQTHNQSLEIERPSNIQQSGKELSNKEMQVYIQQNGLCALRTQMGANNPRFMEYVRNNQLESTLKAEEMGKFNGKSDAIAATSQTIARTNTPVAPEISNTVKAGISSIGIG